VHDGPGEGAAPALVAYLLYRELEGPIDFLCEVLGFRPRFSMAGPDGQLIHVELQIGTATPGGGFAGVVMAGRSARLAPGTVIGTSPRLVLRSRDHEGILDRARARGVRIGPDPAAATPDGEWLPGGHDGGFTLTDPGGYRWVVRPGVASASTAGALAP
jgi:uncharacterized glyoxalase superfamily protein PhnB